MKFVFFGMLALLLVTGCSSERVYDSPLVEVNPVVPYGRVVWNSATDFIYSNESTTISFNVSLNQSGFEIFKSFVASDFDYSDRGLCFKKEHTYIDEDEFPDGDYCIPCMELINGSFRDVCKDYIGELEDGFPDDFTHFLHWDTLGKWGYLVDDSKCYPFFVQGNFSNRYSAYDFYYDYGGICLVNGTKADFGFCFEYEDTGLETLKDVEENNRNKGGLFYVALSNESAFYPTSDSIYVRRSNQMVQWATYILKCEE